MASDPERPGRAVQLALLQTPGSGRHMSRSDSHLISLFWHGKENLSDSTEVSLRTPHLEINTQKSLLGTHPYVILCFRSGLEFSVYAEGTEETGFVEYDTMALSRSLNEFWFQALFRTLQSP